MTQPHYEFHVFVCQNKRPEGHVRGCCASKGSEELANYMKARAKELSIPNVRINKSGCLDQCEQGPAFVVYPEGIWYTLHNIEDVEEVIQKHLLKKEIVPTLLMDKDKKGV